MKTNPVLYRFLLLAVILTLFSCSKQKPFILPNNAVQVLSGETRKTWKLAWPYNDGVRMNMTGCFLTYRITYQSNKTFEDNNGKQENCGPTLSGQWEFIQNKEGISYIKQTSEQFPELLKIDKNYKYFKILQLEEDTLKIQFRHKQFSTTSTFVDTFVPEDITIKDRDFHW